jgi:hypothetical protein
MAMLESTLNKERSYLIQSLIKMRYQIKEVHKTLAEKLK